MVNGVEQEKCDTIRPWKQYVYKLVERCPTGYIDIPLKKVYDRNGNDVTDHYEPNDAEVADLDGDGDMEIIVKRLNTNDAANVYPISNTTEFVMWMLTMSIGIREKIPFCGASTADQIWSV